MNRRIPYIELGKWGMITKSTSRLFEEQMHLFIIHIFRALQNPQLFEVPCYIRNRHIRVVWKSSRKLDMHIFAEVQSLW